MEASKVVIPLFGVLDITGEVIMMWVLMLIVTVIALILRLRLKERPGKFQNIIETGVESLSNFFSGVIGAKKAKQYFTFLGSMFIFIILSNYSGIFPGVGYTDYLKAPTSSLSVTAALGAVTFIYLQICSLRFSVKNYFKKFISPFVLMLPLVLIDEIVRPVSLALRLYGNIFGEETVTEEFFGLVPIGVPVVMMVLSLLFCAIQAMVFTMLTSIYLDEATKLD